ncbi:MAG: hypothetical protein HY875_05270 [Chloroflexi bacterium]|nr:hypothetical protein [Chloroflexota bacterium]
MRTSLVAAIIALGLFVAAELWASGAAPARACTIVRFHTRDLPRNVDSAEVVAVGTLESPSGDVITLVVDEGLKGASAGDRLTINNATNLDCYETVEEGRQNYEAGSRVLVFLIPDTFGVARYKVARAGYDIFRVDGNALVSYGGGAPRSTPEIQDVRAAFRDFAATPNAPALDATTPCWAWNVPPRDAAIFAGIAEAIVIATVVDHRDGATVLRIGESFRGDLRGEITLNDHYFSANEQHLCELSMTSLRGWWPTGTRVAALVVRDEFGVAGWRGVAAGSAVWEVSDGHPVRYEGVPLLSEVREATILAGFQPSVASSDDGWIPTLPVLAALLAVALLVLVVWLRVRR